MGSLLLLLYPGPKIVMQQGTLYMRNIWFSPSLEFGVDRVFGELGKV